MHADKPSGLDILIVDDNEMSRRLIALPLERDGHRIRYATGGLEALELSRSAPPDLMFLDLLMDDINGEEILRQFKSDETLAMTPVVVVSGIDDPEAASRCVAEGAREFVYKPAPVARIREIVSEVASTIASNRASTPALSSIRGTPVLEPQAIEQLQKDYDDIVTIGFIRRFQNNASQHLQGIRKGASDNLLESMKLHTIDLRGSARTLGLHRLATVCQNLETCCNPKLENELHLQVDELAVRLDEALAALEDFIRTRQIED